MITGFLLIVWAAKAWQKQEVTFYQTPLNWPIIGLALAFILSAVFQAPNKIEALTNQAGLIICLTIIYFVIINNIKKRKAVDWLITTLIISSIVLSWLTIFSSLGITANLPWQWLTAKSWTPAGSPLANLSLMVILLPATLYWAFTNKGGTEKVLLFLAASLQILSVILMTFLFVNQEVQFVYLLPQYGWQICAEGLKNFRNILLGAGPNNFLTLFSRFRPAGLNQTPLWSVKFASNSNNYFHLLSTVGLLGLGAYLLTGWQSLVKNFWQGKTIQKVVYLLLATSFAVQLLISANILIWYLTFLSLALLEVIKQREKISLETKKITNRTGIIAFSGLALVISLGAVFFQSRLWLADYYFRKSLLAAQNNKGIETYNLQIKAIQLNPYQESYRTVYSNTNFALANSLAAQKDLSDQEKSKISQLISQSIREAKVAVNLNPQQSNYWVNLAVLYRNIINIAQSADQWAVASYQQAVRTDPTNPLLRINYGGLLFALKDYERATEQFRIATNLKPDYANAFYNLAQSYKAQENWLKAYQNMQQVAYLISPGSSDQQKIINELEELKEKLPSPQPSPELKEKEKVKEEEKITAPSPLPTPNPDLQNITLPEEEVEPKIPDLSPSPQAEENKPASPSGSANE